MVAYTTAAVNTSKGRRPQLTDFVLRWTRKRQSAREQLAVFRALASKAEGADKRVDNR
jgi:hypothetical protein